MSIKKYAHKLKSTRSNSVSRKYLKKKIRIEIIAFLYQDLKKKKLSIFHC